MTKKPELVYRPEFHVCGSELWNWERGHGAYLFKEGMVVACTCGDHFQLRTKAPMFGKWTICWHESRLYWVKVKKDSWKTK